MFKKTNFVNLTFSDTQLSENRVSNDEIDSVSEVAVETEWSVAIVPCRRVHVGHICIHQIVPVAVYVMYLQIKNNKNK